MEPQIFSPALPFFSGAPLSASPPLGRFLPPYYLHTLSFYLEHTKKLPASGGIFLDPFGSSPILPLELASTGAAVLVCCNNPVLRHLLQVAAFSPSLSEFQSILAALSSLKKFNLRLETYLRSLYQSTCNVCEAEVEVDFFLWERESEGTPPQMVSKRYHCVRCGAEGLFPVTNSDQQELEKLPSRSYLEAQAASKVAVLNDHSYPAVIETLRVYSTRSLYAILTLLNKLDELRLTLRQRYLAYGLLIGAFDLCNSLWAYPPKRHRPKQLVLPTHYLENNFWKCLEQAKESWAHFLAKNSLPSVKLHEYPTLPRPGEISIFEGRLSKLLARVPTGQFSAVITILPRPNQAFWTLCVVWSRWLEGRNSAPFLQSALLRKRYDWGWYSRALASVFHLLNRFLPAGTKCFALLEEYEPNFLAAALFAAEAAGLLLESLALRSDQQRAQIHWQTHPSTSHRRVSLEPESQKQSLARIQTEIRFACESHIRRSLEPLSSSQAHAVALAQVVHSAGHQSAASTSEPLLLEAVPFQTVSDYPNFFSQLFEQSVRTSPGLTALDESEKSSGARLWWIKEVQIHHLPQSDRIEDMVFDYLLAHGTATSLEIEQEVLSRTRSITPPSQMLIHECIASYASLDAEKRQWSLKSEELPQNRGRDLLEMRQKIFTLAQELGFRIEEDELIVWSDESQTQKLVWGVQTHAGIYSLLKSFPTDAPFVLVLPGSRVNLFLYKLQLYPFLQARLGKQIHGVRFRQLRWICAQPNVTLTLLERWLSMEPLEYRSLRSPLIPPLGN